ncbi:MAG TPA: SAM-dependent methyltransferase, partial [Armatimonadota bacterium]|nr:SAM-dependent methyltransferase [Armatimonadota bacterium]
EHSVAPDPLALPGLQDLTADVDFSTLIRVCEEEGLELEAFTTQREFLLAMGWMDWLASATPGARRRLTELIDPLLMGRTRVLEMVRR